MLERAWFKSCKPCQASTWSSFDMRPAPKKRTTGFTTCQTLRGKKSSGHVRFQSATQTPWATRFRPAGSGSSSLKHSPFGLLRFIERKWRKVNTEELHEFLL